MGPDGSGSSSKMLTVARPAQLPYWRPMGALERLMAFIEDTCMVPTHIVRSGRQPAYG